MSGNGYRRRRDEREAYEEQELKDRLSLIESMIARGPADTESWGWTFVLWGVAYYVAIGWAAWDNGRGLAGHDDCGRGVVDGRVSSCARTSKACRRLRFGRAMGASGSLWEFRCFFCLCLLASVAGSRPTDLYCGGRCHAGARECGIEHHSEVEGGVCLRGGLVVGDGRFVLWFGRTRARLRFWRRFSFARLSLGSTA